MSFLLLLTGFAVDFEDVGGAIVRGEVGEQVVAGFDGGEQVVEIMRDAAGELANEIEFLGLRQLLPQFFQLQALAHVPARL